MNLTNELSNWQKKNIDIFKFKFVICLKICEFIFNGDYTPSLISQLHTQHYLLYP